MSKQQVPVQHHLDGLVTWLPVLPQDKPGLLRKCIRQCMADEGCHNF